MIRRPCRPARRSLALAFEPLETRSLLAASAGIALNQATVQPAPAAAGAVATRLLVQFQPTATAAVVDATLAGVGGQVQATFPTGLREVDFRTARTATLAAQSLQANPLVAYAQADSIIRTQAAVYPNDPGESASWGLDNPNNVDIDAPEAWGITTGSPSIIVAVLDTGLDLSNADFAGKVWTNPSNDAAAGYPNDTHGWNFVANNNNVQDNDGHGTHVSSLLGAYGNNGSGIAGVAWNVQIMPLKFLDSSGDGTTSDAVSAIYFAVDHGARVINASWGGLGYSQALIQAINYANIHNVVFVTAAGNEGTNNDVVPSYPASFHLPNELSVTSVDSNGALPSFANYGPTTVDIAAPGVNILGDYPTTYAASGVQFLSGTSMSTAYVSGVAALLLSQHPEYTAAQVVQTLDATAKPLPSLAGRTISGGMVDAYYALLANPTTTTPTPTPTPTPVPTPTPTPATVGDAQVQGFILASDEFYAVHGSTPTGYVTALYTNLLGRTPDAPGLAYWSSLDTTTALSRSLIAQAILNSPEGHTTTVAGWYQTDLGRTASLTALKADPGVQFWATFLNVGIAPETVEADLLASFEYLGNHGAAPIPVVAAWYQSILGRQADLGGLTVWANQLVAGLQPVTVVQQLQNSAEGRQTRVARWFQTYLGRTASLASLKADAGVDALAGSLSTT